MVCYSAHLSTLACRRWSRTSLGSPAQRARDDRPVRASSLRHAREASGRVIA